MKEALLPILGIVGNTLLIAAYIPQIVKMLRTKKAGDVSITMWILWFLGDGCFLAYSLIETDLYSSILFGFFTLGNIVILTLISLYGKVPGGGKASKKS